MVQGGGLSLYHEYFKLASEHLLPGGVICQWLPIYEMTPEDLKSVVKTFREYFKYTMLWLTHYDAELVGSNSPILIDEAALERRIAEPAIYGDLSKVMMGSATDFLSYFVMGTEGMKKFSHGGLLTRMITSTLNFQPPFPSPPILSWKAMSML